MIEEDTIQDINGTLESLIEFSHSSTTSIGEIQKDLLKQAMLIDFLALHLLKMDKSKWIAAKKAVDQVYNRASLETRLQNVEEND